MGLYTHTRTLRKTNSASKIIIRAQLIYMLFFFFSWNQVFVNTMSPASARLARVRACVNAQLHRQRSRKKKTRVSHRTPSVRRAVFRKRWRRGGPSFFSLFDSRFFFSFRLSLAFGIWPYPSLHSYPKRGFTRHWYARLA